MEKPRLGLSEIWNMNFGFLGIQFGWGLQLANMSAIYAKLGADPEKIPILWIAGPVTGLLIQPFIGALSDRTWNKLGRRRPFFLVGAILSSIALFIMPDSSVLWMAASLLWILDASINVSMEPFRAFVADKLPEEQHTFGFIMQSFFIGVGATMANALPMVFRFFGISGTAANGVPLTVNYSFKLGAAVFLLCVLWTVFSTREYPPEDLEAFERERAKHKGFSLFSEIILEIFTAVKEMPVTMKQLAVVQIFTWLGLFCMWMFFTLTTAYHVFNAPDSKSPLFDAAQEWGGWCFAIYSFVCFVVAFALPKIAAKLGRRLVHAISLIAGGLSLLSIFFIHDKITLQYTMIGVGLAWASILSIPYAILSDAVPPERTGVYMGVFNFFIVIPEIIASLFLSFLVKDVFGNNPLYVVMMGGASMLIAAACMAMVRDHGAGPTAATNLGGGH